MPSPSRPRVVSGTPMASCPGSARFSPVTGTRCVVSQKKTCLWTGRVMGERQFEARLALPVVFSGQTVRASGFGPPQDFKTPIHTTSEYERYDLSDITRCGAFRSGDGDCLEPLIRPCSGRFFCVRSRRFDVPVWGCTIGALHCCFPSEWVRIHVTGRAVIVRFPRVTSNVDALLAENDAAGREVARLTRELQRFGLIGPPGRDPHRTIGAGVRRSGSGLGQWIGGETRLDPVAANHADGSGRSAQSRQLPRGPHRATVAGSPGSRARP